MKPRNAKECRVAELSATLPALRKTDEERIASGYKRWYGGKGLTYFLILERCKEFQVIRYYYKTSKTLFEFMQLWLNEDTNIVMAKDRFMHVDSWRRDSPMTIKQWFRTEYDYSYLGGVERIGWSACFIRSLLPSLRQRGLKTSVHGITPYRLVQSLLQSNRLETLFKLRQYRLFHHFSQDYNHLSEHLWQAIRVALRHGYHWESQQEVRDWCDMVGDLRYLGIDTHNPHYICPADLLAAHTYWTKRRQRVEETERLQQEKAEVLAYEPIFHKNRQQFLDMLFRDDELQIQVIPTAMGIKEEGIAMHHCVGGYYNRPDSLILSAKIDGRRIETIEVSLKDYHLVQSRGLQNLPTPYHKRIVDLVNAHMNDIRIRNTKKLAS